MELQVQGQTATGINTGSFNPASVAVGLPHRSAAAEASRAVEA